MGTFLQIRVRPKSLPFDNACEIATDDGSQIALSNAEKNKMFEKTLNLPQLGPYWHVNIPGRDPLRIVKTPLVPEQALTMFGSPVVWIDEAEAKKGTAFLRITGLHGDEDEGDAHVRVSDRGRRRRRELRARHRSPTTGGSSAAR